MKIGQTVEWLKDNLSPLKSPHTDLVIAWLTCGGTLLKDNSYIDTIEQTQNGPKRTVTWCIDGDVKALFGDNEMDFREFKSKWNDAEWCKKNNDHPIAHHRLSRDNTVQIRDWLKQQKPAALIRRGNRTAIIPADCPEAQKNKILANL